MHTTEFLPTKSYADMLINMLAVTNFYSDIQKGGTASVIKFTDVTNFTPTNWYWDFGNGNNSTIQNPNHIYSSQGIYSVGLTASNPLLGKGCAFVLILIQLVNFYLSYSKASRHIYFNN